MRIDGTNQYREDLDETREIDVTEMLARNKGMTPGGCNMCGRWTCECGVATKTDICGELSPDDGA